MYQNFTDAQRINRLSQRLLMMMAHADALEQQWRACQQAFDARDWDSLQAHLKAGYRLLQAMQVCD